MHLIQPLFGGPIDIVGDIHGEIDALRELLRVLGYSSDGVHPESRRLVFLGDLTDRGPDSPAVVELVRQLVETERAQCVLGNHDLNILLGKVKHDNHWYFGEEWSLDNSGKPTPAVLADDEIRRSVREFFKTLPLCLEREDVRVAHACWDDEMVNIARAYDDVLALYSEYKAQIDIKHHSGSNIDDINRGLEHQNLNPVKVLTSGIERRIKKPFEASGKLRYEERVRWWEAYPETEPLCVFGHYSSPEVRPVSGAFCVDFGVAKRWQERKQPGFSGSFQLRLGAVRLPERKVLFDDGSSVDSI